MDNIIGKRLLIFTAHPDDESFVSGGTIYANNRNSGVTFLACATHGEHGRTNLDGNLAEEDIKTLRHKELNEAAKELGISQVNILNFPDRSLAKNKAKLSAVWRDLVASVKPEVILGFGRDGYTGHLDHVIGGSIAYKLAREFKTPYYAFSLPGGKRHLSFEDSLQKKRYQGNYVNQCLHKEPDITVEVNPGVKYRILKIYESQLPGLDPYRIFSKEDAEHFLKYEYFTKL